MKYLQKILFITIITVVFGGVSNAQEYPKVFLVPMEDGFDNFIAAAFIKEKVPVTIVAQEGTADYIITGTAAKGSNKWYDTVFGGEKDRNQGSLKMLRVSDKTIVWAGSQGDRSLWWGSLAKTGQKKVAERLAQALKKEYFKNKKQIK